MPKVWKVKMLSGCNCGCKGYEFQYVGTYKPQSTDVSKALREAGFKCCGCASNDFVVTEA